MLQQLTLLAVVLTAVLNVGYGYTFYRERLPNFNRIPHPCKPNFMWYGIGHNNSKGGGPRNAFGKAFAEWGYEWNVCLCKEDSDGDGRTNGEELGDPDCVWSVGKVPTYSKGLSHPGICEPFDDPKCAGKNDWVDCSQESNFQCDAINDTDVQMFTLQFDKTNVPGKDTTYVCQGFNLTEMLPPGDSHLIALTPKIDNKNVMHHILVYACDDVRGPAVLESYKTPGECGMEATACQSIVGLWTVGNDGFCFNDQYGFAMGTNGFKYVVMQFHWNNPELRTDFTDESGMNFYVNTNERPNDGGVWFIGPPSLTIPPGFPTYSEKGGCPGTCTKLKLDKPVYLTDIIPHMHYLGTAFKFNLYRNGQLIDKFHLDNYEYDNPVIETFENLIEVLPGDDLQVECVFQSKNEKTVTFFGDATSDEMCFAIFLYYPFTSSLTEFCLGTDDGYCYHNKLVPNPFAPGICNISELIAISERDSAQIWESCDPNGLECLPNCKAALSAFENHHCLTGNTSSIALSAYANSREGRQMLSRLVSCYERPASIPGDNNQGQPSVCEIIASGQPTVTPVITYGLLVCFTLLQVIAMYQ